MAMLNNQMVYIIYMRGQLISVIRTTPASGKRTEKIEKICGRVRELGITPNIAIYWQKWWLAKWISWHPPNSVTLYPPQAGPDRGPGKDMAEPAKEPQLILVDSWASINGSTDQLGKEALILVSKICKLMIVQPFETPTSGLWKAVTIWFPSRGVSTSSSRDYQLNISLYSNIM